MPRAPIDNLNEIVDGHSAKEGTIQFLVAPATTHALLRIIVANQTTELPITLKP